MRSPGKGLLGAGLRQKPSRRPTSELSQTRAQESWVLRGPGCPSTQTCLAGAWSPSPLWALVSSPRMGTLAAIPPAPEWTGFARISGYPGKMEPLTMPGPQSRFPLSGYVKVAEFPGPGHHGTPILFSAQLFVFCLGQDPQVCSPSGPRVCWLAGTGCWGVSASGFWLQVLKAS